MDNHPRSDNISILVKGHGVIFTEQLELFKGRALQQCEEFMCGSSALVQTVS